MLPTPVGFPSNIDANSPIAIGSWPAIAISGAVVLVAPEDEIFDMFKPASTSLMLHCGLATSSIRIGRR
jgi:hypothetical protein